jgi:hypothetical protein
MFVPEIIVKYPLIQKIKSGIKDVHCIMPAQSFNNMMRFKHFVVHKVNQQQTN